MYKSYKFYDASTSKGLFCIVIFCFATIFLCWLIRIKLFPCYVKSGMLSLPSMSSFCCWDSKPKRQLWFYAAAVPEIGILFSEFGPTYAGFCLGVGERYLNHTSTNIVGKRLLAEKSRCGKMVERFREKMSKRYESLFVFDFQPFQASVFI